MTHAHIDLPNKEQYLRQLKQTPTISWPAFGLFFLGMGMIVVASAAAVEGSLPLWGGTLINGLGLYFLFSIMHEALHRNVSANNGVNELLGRFSLLLLIPAAPIEIARWAHFQHHRFTSSEQDPDNFIHDAKWWQIPIRWPNFDLHYLVSFLRYGAEERKRRAPALIVSALVFAAIVAVLVAAGYGWEMLFLWILASRVALTLIALVFVYLPHYPATITAQENQYKATTIRKGWEFLLTPLFVFQNYHLIHHLYPTAPFYNYIKIWHLKYEDLIAENPPIQQAFARTPINLESTVSAPLVPLTEPVSGQDVDSQPRENV